MGYEAYECSCAEFTLTTGGNVRSDYDGTYTLIQNPGAPANDGKPVFRHSSGSYLYYYSSSSMWYGGDDYTSGSIGLSSAATSLACPHSLNTIELYNGNWIQDTLSIVCPPPNLGGCPGAWTVNGSYGAGARVAKDNIVYECKTYPFSAHCPQMGYEPGVAWGTLEYWMLAWQVVGICSGTSSPPTSGRATPWAIS